MNEITTEQELCLLRMVVLGVSFGMCGSIPLFQNATTDTLVYIGMSLGGGIAGFGVGYTGVVAQNYCSTRTLFSPVPREMGAEETPIETISSSISYS